MSMTPAMESIFANAQQNAASLIETATLAINAKVNTIEEAEKMIQDLSSEAVKFNELLTTIMNAMRQVESGDMQKEEAAGIIAPAVKELKDKCTALKISNAEAPGDDITEDEIAILRELIIGAKAAAEDRLVAIRLGDDDKVDPEVEAEVNTPDEEPEDAAEEGLTDAEVATEAAFLAAKYVNTNDTKTAKALYSNAKKLYSLGSKDKALQYMKQAKKLYEKALAALLKSGKFTNVERTESFKKSGTTVGIRKTTTQADSMSFAIARSTLEAKIDRCQAHILQWTTKAGKETYQQTLDQLKADREQAKAAKKAAKATENYESEDNTVMEKYSEFMYACESMMNELELELATGAMEAEGAEGEESGAPAASASKMKSGFAKLKAAFKRGDKKAADEAKAEIKEEADKLAEVSDEDPKKDKMSTAGKVALVAAAGVAATVGLANLGQALQKSASKKGVTPKGASAQIIKAADAICNAVGKNKGTFAAGVTAAAASGAVLGGAAGKKAGEMINKKIDEKKAKKAADAAAEAFGLESYDVYEVIQEFFAPDQIDMNDIDAATEAAIEFTYAMEEVYENLEVATESQSWQAVKGILGEKSRAARKAVKAGKKAAKAGNKAEAVAKFKEAKELFGEQKAALQKLPKDMWDTIASWLTVGWIPLIYSFIGEGGYKDAPNKNVNVAAVINYLNRAMKKCDELAANAGKEEAPAEESLDAAMAAMLESFGTAQDEHDEIDAAIAADMQ